MFLAGNNTLKIKWIIWAGVITLALCVLGVLFFDRPGYLFLRHFDCFIWRLFGYIFDAKVWLGISGILTGVFFIKKLQKSRCKFRNVKNKFSPIVFFKEFIEKTKGCPAFLIFCSVLSASVVGTFFKVLLGRARPVFFEALN